MKCNHLLGLTCPIQEEPIEASIVYENRRHKPIEFEVKFYFCPLCGETINGHEILENGKEIIMIARIKYLSSNWKLGIHLLFRTYRFGVNNQWWSPFDSMFGLSLYQRFRPNQVQQSWQGIKFRCIACKFIDEDHSKLLFGR